MENDTQRLFVAGLRFLGLLLQSSILPREKSPWRRKGVVERKWQPLEGASAAGRELAKILVVFKCPFPTMFKNPRKGLIGCHP